MMHHRSKVEAGPRHLAGAPLLEPIRSPRRIAPLLHRKSQAQTSRPMPCLARTPQQVGHVNPRDSGAWDQLPKTGEQITSLRIPKVTSPTQPARRLLRIGPRSVDPQSPQPRACTRAPSVTELRAREDVPRLAPDPKHAKVRPIRFGIRRSTSHRNRLAPSAATPHPRDHPSGCRENSQTEAPRQFDTLTSRSNESVGAPTPRCRTNTKCTPS